MSLSCRLLRRSALCVLSLVSGLCAAQQSIQFLSVPQVQPTNGRVTSFVTGVFQNPQGGTDILYINAPTVSGGVSGVTAGELLNKQGGFYNLGENQIAFSKVSNTVAALADFDNDTRST